MTRRRNAGRFSVLMTDSAASPHCASSRISSRGIAPARRCAGGRSMEERRVEKRTDIEETTDLERQRSRPGMTNVNVGPDGETQVQESEVVDDPVGTTTVRKETRIEDRESR